MQIRNNSQTETLNFVVKGEPKDGVAPTESVLPGETKNIDVLDEHAGEIVGRVVAGLITVGGSERKRHKE